MTILFLILMISGTLSLGASDVLKKKYLNANFDEQALLTITLFLTGILLLPILLLTGTPELKTGLWPAATITILLNLISQNLFIQAFRLRDASLIAPLRLIIPPLVIITGFLILNEKPSLAGIIGIFITVAGLWLLLAKNKSERLNVLEIVKDRGIRYGLIGSVLFAVSFPFDKVIVAKSSAIFSTFLVFTILGILTYIINVIRDRHFASTTWHSLIKYPKENLFVSILSSIGIVLTNQALNYSLVAYASSLKRLQALWTIIIAGQFLKEKETGRRILATSIMMIGILISALWK